MIGFRLAGFGAPPQISRVKLIQRALYFRSWYLDRSVQILHSVEKEGEKIACSLGLTASSRGSVGLALNVCQSTFEEILRSQDALPQNLILGGAISTCRLLEAFPNRRVRGYRHASTFPYNLERCDDHEAEIAAVGDLPESDWPSIGLSMPVTSNPIAARRAISRLIATYPGTLKVAVVNNGLPEPDGNQLLKFEADFGDRVWVLRNSGNPSRAQAINLGLEHLWQDEWFDMFGVINEDVLPSIATISEMVDAMRELQGFGQKPGVVGPSLVTRPTAKTVEEFDSQALSAFEEFHRSADEVERVDGRFMLIDFEAISEVGGFDTNFDQWFMDDDWCLRARLAGFRNWIAPGALVCPGHSASMQKIEGDRDAFLGKWNRCTDEPTSKIHLPILGSRDFAA